MREYALSDSKTKSLKFARETPFHLALQMGQVDARMLFERGVDLTAQNNDGRTPLHLTSYCGQVDITCMLVGSGADLITQNRVRETPENVH